MSMDGEPLALARSLTAAAGLPIPVAATALTGGKNNRVFAVTLAGGSQVVLKSYHHDPRDTRDRLGAEWAFLSHVWSLGVRNVPQPLASSPSDHAGLYGMVPGARPDPVTPDLIAQAADFAVSINCGAMPGLAPGSEACFSIAEHVATVSRRVARLAQLDADAPHLGAANRFVAERLTPQWQRVSELIASSSDRCSVDPAARIARPIVSPSDFGFHNCLVESGTARFIDFEYAGMDDPAKLVCDFFCQPEVPVPLDQFDAFVTRLAAGLGLQEDDTWRCRLLLDAYRIKWTCIILNEFLPLGASRRAFADASDRALRAERQLQRAERQIGLIAP